MFPFGVNVSKKKGPMNDSKMMKVKEFNKKKTCQKQLYHSKE